MIDHGTCCVRKLSFERQSSLCAAEQAKNEHARSVVLRILDGAVWQNAHLLPHDVAVFEARVAEGYGARWSADGTQART